MSICLGKSRLLAFVLLVLVATSSCKTLVPAELDDSPSIRQIRLLSYQRDRNFPFRTEINNGRLSSISGLLSEPLKTENEFIEVATDFIHKNSELFSIDDFSTNFPNSNILPSNNTLQHIVYKQFYKGLPVFDRMMVAHTNISGHLYSVQTNYLPIVSLAVVPTITETQIKKTIEEIDTKQTTKVRHIELGIHTYDTDPILSYKIVYQSGSEEYEIYVDAHNGVLVSKLPAWREQSGSGVDLLDNDVSDLTFVHTSNLTNDYLEDIPGLSPAWEEGILNASREIYNLIDDSLLPSGPVHIFTDGQSGRFLEYEVNMIGNETTQISSDSPLKQAAVSAYSNLAKVRDYFSDVFGRRGHDDQNGSIVVLIDHTPTREETRDANAFWQASRSTIGFNSLHEFDNTRSAATALDIVAHEYLHAVLSHTAQLRYEGNSGALEEAIADFFGYLIKAHYESGSESIPNWCSGDGIYIYRPNADEHNCQNTEHHLIRPFNRPYHVDEIFDDLGSSEADSDESEGDVWNDVHRNSTIPVIVFALLLEGGQHYGVDVNPIYENVRDDPQVHALARRKLANLLYEWITGGYLYPIADFADARSSMIRAAEALFGVSDPIVNEIDAAWRAVGIDSSTFLRCEIPYFTNFDDGIESCWLARHYGINHQPESTLILSRDHLLNDYYSFPSAKISFSTPDDLPLNESIFLEIDSELFGNNTEGVIGIANPEDSDSMTEIYRFNAQNRGYDVINLSRMAHLAGIDISETLTLHILPVCGNFPGCGIKLYSVELFSSENNYFGLEDFLFENPISIPDDTELPQLFLESNFDSVLEGSEENATLKISLSQPLDFQLVVVPKITGDTDDYSLFPQGWFIIPAGKLDAEIQFKANEDNNYEGDEIFQVSLDEVIGLGPVSAVQQPISITIEDANGLPRIKLSSADGRMATIEEQGESIEVFAELDKDSSVAVSDIEIALSYGGSANMFQDYRVDQPSILIPAYHRKGSIDVVSIEDNRNEDNEIIEISAAAANLGEIIDDRVDITIKEPPSITLFNVEGDVAEGETKQILVSLSEPVRTDISVLLQATENSTAQTETDYTLTGPDLVIIPAGQIQGLLNIRTIEDSIWEPLPESVEFGYRQVNGWVQHNPEETIQFMIKDNDTIPVISLSSDSTSLAEGNTAIINAQLSHGAELDLVYLLETVESDVDSQIDVQVPQRIVIPALSEQKSFSLTALSDGQQEGLETIVIKPTRIRNEPTTFNVDINSLTPEAFLLDDILLPGLVNMGAANIRDIVSEYSQLFEPNETLSFNIIDEPSVSIVSPPDLLSPESHTFEENGGQTGFQIKLNKTWHSDVTALIETETIVPEPIRGVDYQMPAGATVVAGQLRAFVPITGIADTNSDEGQTDEFRVKLGAIENGHIDTQKMSTHFIILNSETADSNSNQNDDCPVPPLEFENRHSENFNGPNLSAYWQQHSSTDYGRFRINGSLLMDAIPGVPFGTINHNVASLYVNLENKRNVELKLVYNHSNLSSGWLSYHAYSNAGSDEWIGLQNFPAGGVSTFHRHMTIDISDLVRRSSGEELSNCFKITITQVGNAQWEGSNPNTFVEGLNIHELRLTAD